MESILKSIKTKKIPINPAVVISNKSDAKGLRIAKKMGISVEVIESKSFKGNRRSHIIICSVKGCFTSNGDARWL